MARITITQATLTGLELLFSIITFVLFCSAYPDQYRTRLWEIGGENGWNSNPRLRIYFYANYEEPPEIPYVWSQSLTDSALAIATLSLVLCITRIILSFYTFMMPALGLFYDLVLAISWYYSVHAQSSGDFSDPEHISIRPWFLEKSCDVVAMQNRDACIVGKVSFYFGFLSLILHLTRLLVSLLNIAYWCGERGTLDGFTERVSLGLIRNPDSKMYRPLDLDVERLDASST
ncbi:hypothetical protein PGQ11_001826 [Apiospora arundinis]|uniref:Uncharacterized protein n=1 Tax=Apiospora arundinis TaxID=335852 RepID=A0ABR2JHY7_9PEZI